MKKRNKKETGITLIALILTIIVLLILAGVSVTSISGEKEFLTKTQSAVKKNLEAVEKEAIIIAMQTHQGNASTLADELKEQDWCSEATYHENSKTTTIKFEDSQNEYTILENRTIYKGVFSEIVTNIDELYTAIKNAETSGEIIGIVGEISLSRSISASGKEIKFAGVNEESCLVLPNSAINADGASLIFENLKYIATNTIYTGIRGTAKEKLINCTIENTYWPNAPIVEFENCTFVQNGSDNYNIWTYLNGEITFTNCKFNCNGKGLLIYKDGGSGASTINVNNCTFFATAPVEGKAAIEIDSSYKTFVVNINNCVSNGFGTGSVSGNSLYNNKKGTATTLIVDGIQILP